MNSVKIGTYQMDTAFGLYLPEYTIPAPAPQTKFVKIIGRDGSVDLSDAIGLHYDSRSWSLDFKCFDPTVNWHTLTSSVMNAIHGKRLNFEFDDDPDYFWTGRISVSSYVSTRGTGTLKVNITSDPFKYAKLSTIVTKTASTGTEYTGSMVTFNDGLIYDLSADIEPIQDLHGYANPWPAGGGVNKIGIPDGVDFTLRGVRYYTDAGSLYMDGTSTGETSSASAAFKTNFSFTLQPGYYYFSRMSYNRPVYLLSDSGTLATNSGTFSIAEPTVVWIGFYIYNAVFDNAQCPIIITESSAPSEYSPFSNICPISGLTGLSVYRTGKNLFGGTLINGYVPLDLPVGTYTVSADRIDSTQQAYFYIRRAASGTTTYENVVQPVVGSIVSPKTFSVEAGYDYYAWCNSSYINVKDVQIELGSTATTYEPYNGNTYAVDWTTQAGTVYGGTVDPVAGQLTVDRASVLFDGTQTVGLANWMPNSSSVGWLYAPSATPGLLNVTIDSSNLQSCGLLSDTLETVVYSGSTGVYGETSPCISLVGSTHWGVAMRLNDTTLTTAAKINEYLSANPIRVVYKLATPITYQLTPKEIEALVGTNNVWSSSGDVTVTVVTPETVTNNGLPAIPTVTASADMVLRWGNYSASVQQGTSTIPQLVLETGDNKICIIGTGNISFEWSEASL